ncbi:MAG TPA: transglutaminase-like domain-containing protein [Rhizomicrobium sp.]|jgi:regulator of sirC expression with transglutaminase-like and TPR domain|nr:transglutaminase-like domain-containing protein [Rhizomicrobium sp.]
MRLLPDDPVKYLHQLGEAGDADRDIAGAALMLSALDNPGRDLDPYIAHLAEIAENSRLRASFAMDAESAGAALSSVVSGYYGYDGDRLAYDDPRNADLISVIDRRRGLPVALGIVYLHAMRAAGFRALGLTSPGHFLLQLEVRSSHVLIDPFNGGAGVERERLGTYPNMRSVGENPADSFQPVDDVDVLLRLENNQKIRAMQAGDAIRALTLTKRMVLIAPKRAELWVDLAQLHEGEGELAAARTAYGTCLMLAQPGAPLHNEAALGLEDLKRRLN